MYEYLRVQDHGGHCCGINHIQGFDELESYELSGKNWQGRLKKHVINLVDKCFLSADQVVQANSWDNEAPEGTVAVECCIASRQPKAEEIREILTDIGFMETVSWENVNTQDTITQFMYIDPDFVRPNPSEWVL